jgi:hypothetical protein
MTDVKGVKHHDFGSINCMQKIYADLNEDIDPQLLKDIGRNQSLLSLIKDHGHKLNIKALFQSGLEQKDISFEPPLKICQELTLI